VINRKGNPQMSNEANDKWNCNSAPKKLEMWGGGVKLQKQIRIMGLKKIEICSFYEKRN
jgi:hypothetical protein